MARSVVRRIESPRKRKRLDGLTVTIAAVVAAFALVGVVSAGTYVAGQVNPGSTPKAQSGAGNKIAVRDVARAQAQATAIVSAANAASRQVVNSATTNARAHAARIMANAHRQAALIIQQARINAAQQTAPVVTAPQPVATYAAPTTYTAPAPVIQTGTGSGASTVPNLGTLPKSWLVVAYGATFGSGPGSVGGVSILNRGSRTYGGTVVVKYNTGGSATAPFSGLAPGQSAVLALSGKTYAGGGFSIQVNVG